MKTLLCITLLLFAAGCRFAVYAAVGPQELEGLKLELGLAKPDPNLPESLAVEAARLLLK